MKTLTIRRYGTRFDIESGDGRLHVLCPQALAWNLVCTYGFKKKEAKKIVAQLEDNDVVVIERVAA